MKKRALLLSILSLLMIVSSRGSVMAAACNDFSKYGSVSVGLPVLPSRGSYVVWTRMQVPDATHNQYELEISGTACYQVGGSSLTPGQWTWVNFQDGDLSNKVEHDFDHTSDNTVKLIGTQAGVKIDRLLLIKGDCVPTDLGANCQTNTVAIDPNDIAGATEVPPLSAGPVSGIIIPSQSIVRAPLTIAKVVYFSESQAIPTAYNNGIDTTLLSNGKHKITMQITATNGTVTNEATTLEVRNPQNAFSPIKRWVRLNAKTAVTISSVMGGLLVLTAVFLIYRHMKLQKRLLEFKGF
jgi:hypothetical protein